TSAGQVQAGVSVFNVFGTHTFAEEGTYRVKVTINDTDGTATVGSTLTVASTTVNVLDAPLVPVNSPITVPAIAGATTGQVVVGAFTDTDPGGVAADYTGTINWGDGSTTAVASFTRFAGSTFNVQGAHTYAFPGVYR